MRFKRDGANWWWGWFPRERPSEGRWFEAYFYFVGWDCLQLGLHVALSRPNIEVHVPFGFFRIGWQKIERITLTWEEVYAGLAARSEAEIVGRGEP